MLKNNSLWTVIEELREELEQAERELRTAYLAGHYDGYHGTEDSYDKYVKTGQLIPKGEDNVNDNI